ncbi:MAG TPA: endonuclease/exonuclease/phosphatase family protein [Myxococcaceae bacterium]|jgi:endonuclease/exonuclease/phosphatase family metal-dependent hydrolase|nr:endonuclease/exonuclease/phosphatase family protein [Myxococcaceae bacterium]
MPRRPLRVVSYNVRYFGHALKGLATTRRSMEGIARGLAHLVPAADLVCFQEVETRSLRSTLAFRAHRDTQLESFMEALEAEYRRLKRPFPYEAFHFPAHTYRFRRTTLYTTGLAVLVDTQRLTVQGHNVKAPHPITHHHVARLRNTKQSRICAHVRLTTGPGRVLHLFNTHLSLPTPFARSFWSARAKMGFGPNQLQEARKLVAYVQALAGSEPFLVCGDFNSPPASLVYRFLTEEAHWSGAQEKLEQIDPVAPTFATAGFFRLRMHLDHLFGGNGIRWVDLEGTAPYGAGPFHGLSDHVPLIARFQVGDPLASRSDHVA